MGETELTSQDIARLLFDLESLTAGADDATLITVAIAAMLAPVIYTWEFTFNIGKNIIENAGERPKFFDRTRLISGLLVWGLILFYIPVFSFFEYMVSLLVDMTAPEAYFDWKEAHAELISEVPGETTDLGDSDLREDGEEQEDDSSSLIDMMGGLINVRMAIQEGFQSMAMTMTQSLFSLLGFLASIIVDGLSLVIGKVFYVIGPLALAFSISSAFKDKLNKWFGTWLLLLFNPLTTNVLNTILISLTYSQFSEAIDLDFTFKTGVGVVLFNLIIIICYILTFWITGFYVGSPEAGKILSTAGAMATDVASGGAASTAIKGFGSKVGHAVQSFRGKKEE